VISRQKRMSRDQRGDIHLSDSFRWVVSLLFFGRDDGNRLVGRQLIVRRLWLLEFSLVTVVSLNFGRRNNNGCDRVMRGYLLLHSWLEFMCDILLIVAVDVAVDAE